MDLQNIKLNYKSLKSNFYYKLYIKFDKRLYIRSYNTLDGINCITLILSGHHGHFLTKREPKKI